MGSSQQEFIRYRRSRFTTRLPVNHRYTASHSWLLEREPGLWRVGFTHFATRMLGDLVEYEFKVEPGVPVEVGASIGWIEGFKALTDLYCVASGEFQGSSPELEKDVTLLDHDPYRRGWLYEVRGEPEPNSLDVHAYIGILDATIDKMLEREREGHG